MTETRNIAAILAADVVGIGRMASADDDGKLAPARKRSLVEGAGCAKNRPCACQMLGWSKSLVENCEIVTSTFDVAGASASCGKNS